MMKKLLFIILLFYTQLFFAQIQSGEMIYKTKMLTSDPFNLDEIKQESPEIHGVFANYDRKIKNSIGFLEFKLLFNQTEASYQSKEVLASDNSALDIDFTLGIVRGEGGFYANQIENIRINQKKYERKTYLITDKFKEVEWEIHHETKEILGYKVLKATATVRLNQIKSGEVVAWFAPQIPFQFGPINYGGLPGLILELEINGYAHYADEIKLNKKSQKIKRPTEGKVLSRNEFEEMIMDGISFLQD